MLMSLTDYWFLVTYLRRPRVWAVSLISSVLWKKWQKNLLSLPRRDPSYFFLFLGHYYEQPFFEANYRLRRLDDLKEFEYKYEIISLSSILRIYNLRFYIYHLEYVTLRMRANQSEMFLLRAIFVQASLFIT